MIQIRVVLLIALLAVSSGCMMMPMMHSDGAMSDRHAAHHAGAADENDSEVEKKQ